MVVVGAVAAVAPLAARPPGAEKVGCRGLAYALLLCAPQACPNPLAECGRSGVTIEGADGEL